MHNDTSSQLFPFLNLNMENLLKVLSAEQLLHYFTTYIQCSAVLNNNLMNVVNRTCIKSVP